MKHSVPVALCLLLVAGLTFFGASADNEEYEVVIMRWQNYVEVTTDDEVGYKGIAFANCSYGLSLDWMEATHQTVNVYFEGELIQTFDENDSSWEGPFVYNESDPYCIHGDGRSWYIATLYGELEFDEEGEYLITNHYERSISITDGYDWGPVDGLPDLYGPTSDYWETTVHVMKE